MKRLILSACTFIMIAHIQLAFATLSSDTEKLLNWAEKTFPQFFPNPQVTQNIEPWLFRYYPETGVYAGVNKSDNTAYVLGGPWGNNPAVVDTLANLITQIDSSGGNSGIAGCDTTDALSGVSYSQSGTVVTVTTNGQCVTAPDISKTNLCQVPQQTAASGVSMLGSNTITESRIEGLSTSIPGLPNPFQAIVDAAANVKHCTMNAPAATANLVVNSDLCLDITASISETLAGLPVTGIVVSPPVKYYTKGTYTSQTVSDCFNTDATTVSDAFTGEVWVKQSGSFVKIQ
ncbi:hypothetical protein [Nitrosomonas oligotropha]|uniref:Uncharacterized protein n=1 Tax=Nitrosomonas oligotropha TaxID=42354 RepID=A0A1H8LTV9_9PROT|nr:hypothetical protein [Nitrosomonas oligotropha]SDW39535.1 hypothetical protein SAMN05216300_10482 [Nitrosomonas oligotropha]SEO08554.1 hypothetical protein SAMN05216333_10458 [Nitrosomonas oligotropha]